MKNLLILSAILLSQVTMSAPYVEYKRSEKINPSSPHSEYLRAGYKYKNVYAEVGKDSSEIGYKWKPLKNFIIKGKIERVSGKDKLETEVRYTFQ